MTPTTLSLPNVAPLGSSGKTGEGRFVRVTSSDPAQATTVGAFLRAKKGSYPCSLWDKKRNRYVICGECECREYIEAFQRHPVNNNVARDESRHELLTDFRRGGRDDLNGDDDIGAIARQADDLVYREWVLQSSEEW